MDLIIITTEKPSVAQEYKKVLQIDQKEKTNGYIEGYSKIIDKQVIITWAVGHLCTLSLPEKYDEALKKWSLEMLPFLPTQYKYEVLPAVAKQFNIIKKLYHSTYPDGRKFTNPLSAIYLAGDSGREGIYIQELICRVAGVNQNITRNVVWIDSYTEKEILRGIKEAKPVAAYEKKIDAAFMRAIEDYMVGINFSRALSCKYGPEFNKRIAADKWKTIAVGRVMTCVLGMVVEREREIRDFKETCFYKLEADIGEISCEWKAIEKSSYYGSPHLYNETGFKDRDKAAFLLETLKKDQTILVEKMEKKTEKKGSPLLFNLAEIQFFCSKKYKISPDETLSVIQSLYEKKLVTYPRTDARVLSTAVAEEIGNNLNGLCRLNYKLDLLKKIASNGWHKKIVNSPYVNDAKITDHYAIIPTGYIAGADSLSDMEKAIYHDIIDRFLGIFFPPAIYEKKEVTLRHSINEWFFGSVKTLQEAGYLEVIGGEEAQVKKNPLNDLKIGEVVAAQFRIKEGKTTPPKRYTSGSMVIAMENAGKMIEDEELRDQIKGSGIGTSATRAEIIKKLVAIYYLSLNNKTQILTPSVIGEAVYDICSSNLPEVLRPEMTAEWEKGLEEIEDGTVQKTEYRSKLEAYVSRTIEKIKDGVTTEYKGEAPKPKQAENIHCPLCAEGILFEGKKAFGCSRYNEGCKFTIWKEIAGKKISMSMVEKMVKGQKTPVIKGFKKKDGGSFDAALEFKDGKVNFVFSRKKQN